MHIKWRIAENAGKANIYMYLADEGAKYLNVAYMKNIYVVLFKISFSL